MCSRRELGILLGSQYGFSLWARHPIREHLHKNEIRISAGDAIGSVLATVFARGDETFYDDVLLVDADGQLIGLISTQTLFKVQNALLRANIIELQTKEREIQTRNTQMEADLRMAMELQQALLPKEYPLFPPTATSETAHLRFFALIINRRVSLAAIFLHRPDLGSRSRRFHFRRDGPRRPLSPITAMLRALIEAEAASLADPGLVLNVFELGAHRHFKTNRHCSLRDRALLRVRFRTAHHAPRARRPSPAPPYPAECGRNPIRG